MFVRPCGKCRWSFRLVGIVAMTALGVCTPTFAYAQGNLDKEVGVRVFSDSAESQAVDAMVDRSWYGDRITFSINATTSIRY